MKIRISNKWNKEEKAYDKTLFDIKETEGAIFGRFTMSIKKEEKWASAHMSFVVYKSKVDLETQNAILRHAGKAIEVSGNLSVDAASDGKGYFKFVITSAKLPEEKKPVAHFQETEGFEEDNEIPF